MSGRNAPGAGGIKLFRPLVVGAVAANTDPTSHNKRMTMTVGGAFTTEQRRVYQGDVTVTGNVGDKIGLTLASGTFEIERSPGLTTDQMATALAGVCTLGTYDKWVVRYTGGPAAGGELARLTIDGTNYDYTAGAGDTVAVIALAVATAAAGDTKYTVTRIGATGNMSVTAINRGVGYAVAGSITGALGVTDTHRITGIAADTTWGVSVPAGSTVMCEHLALGPTTDTVTATMTGAAVFAQAITQEGYASDVARVTDGSNTYSYTIVSGDTDDLIATRLATAISGNNGYLAAFTAPGELTITRTDFATFPDFVDVSTTPNPASTFVLTPAVTQVLVPKMSATAGMSVEGSKLATGTIEYGLAIGTQFDCRMWFYDPNVADWLPDLTGTVTVSGNGFLPVALAGTRAYAQVSAFIGGAVANVALRTNG